MKKQFITIACIALSLLLFVGCGNNTAKIKGELKNAEGRNVYIEELNISVRKLVDSAKTNGQGNFSFNYKFTKDEPSFIILRTDSVMLATFLLEQGETLQYSGDLKRPNHYTVNGSEGSALVKQLNDELLATTRKFDSLSKVLQKKEEGTAEYTEVSREIGSLIVNHKRDLIRFILTYPTSYASFTAIYQRLSDDVAFFGKESDMLYYKTLVDSLMPRYPKSMYVKILNDDYKQIENFVNLQNMINQAEIIDAMPNIELENNEGRKVKLSSLRGKFVLIDFWVAENKELLMANRELVDIYNKYKGRNFEIYQISEDKDKNIWLEAIHNQELKWISVRDSQTSSAATLYNVTQLPANYLINDSGELVVKNVFGENLDKKLNEILPK